MTLSHINPLPAPSILLDKCQMKSFEDINILIIIKLFCLKTVCFGKSFYVKKSMLKKK